VGEENLTCVSAAVAACARALTAAVHRKG